MARCAQLLQECLGGCTTPGSAADAVCTVTGSPGCSVGPPAFPFPPSLERTDELLCAALRCAARKVRGRKEATCGKPRGRTPTLALVLRRKTQVSCRDVWDCGRIGGGMSLCAHPQYWRRSLRKLPEVCAAGWKLKSGQVEARGHNGSAGRSYSPRTATTTRASSPMDSQPV